MIPPKVNLSGDTDKAEGLRAFGLSQLRILQEQMTFQNLEQDIRRVNFSDGTLIEARSIFGLDEVNIFVPVMAEKVEVEEEVKGKARAIIEVLGSKICMWAEEVAIVVCDPETIPPISWPEDKNPESIDRGTWAFIYVEGGVSSYTWEVKGRGYFFDAEYILTKLENPGNIGGWCDPAVGNTQEICEGNGGTWRFPGCRVKLYADNTICGKAQITVTDICLQIAVGEVPYDKTLKWSDENPIEMDLGAVITLCIIDGEAPYVWEVKGKGFWFDAEYTLQEVITDNKCVTLYAEESSIVPINIWPFHAGACPPANITVEDDCGSEVDGEVGIFGRKKLAWDDGEPIEVCPGDLVDIVWTGGTPPFYITLSSCSLVGPFTLALFGSFALPCCFDLILWRSVQVYVFPEFCKEEATLTIEDTCGEKINREVEIKQPELASQIQYTTLQMAINEQQGLSAVNEGGCVGTKHTWEITSGGGDLSITEGASTVYTAPAANPNCVDNATITLSYCGAVVDSITIAINEWTGTETAYYIFSTCYDCGGLGDWICVSKSDYTCNGVLKSTYSICAAWGWDECHNVCEVNHPAGTYDARTQAMKDGGCCPEGLM